MSYRNPRVVIDNRLGEAFIQNTKDFGESLTTSAISVGKQVQARREINAKIVNDINNYQSKVDDNLVKVAIENKTDVNSFINGTKDMAKLFKQAKFRKLKNQGSYEGMDEDEDLIRSYSTYVQSAGSYMAAMSSASEEYSTTLDSKGMGKAPGQISSDSDSRWIIANNLARSGNNSSGKIEYKTVYGGPASGVQLMMVVSGESIKKANEELAEKTGDSSYLESGDTYTLSANDLASRNTGSNASPFSKGPYSINPDMIGSGEEGSTGVLKDFIANKVIGKNRNLTDEYMSQPETVIRSVIIDGQTKKYYVDGKTPNTKKIEEDIKSSTNSYINSTARLGGNAMNNLLNGIAKSRKTASGEVELYYNPALRNEDGQPQRDESGKVLFGPEVILSDDGTLETDYNDETSGTFGYTPEVMNKLKDFALHFAVENVGGFNDPTETENTKKQFIKEEKPDKIEPASPPSRKDNQVAFSQDKVNQAVLFIEKFVKDKGNLRLDTEEDKQNVVSSSDVSSDDADDFVTNNKSKFNDLGIKVVTNEYNKITLSSLNDDRVEPTDFKIDAFTDDGDEEYAKAINDWVKKNGSFAKNSDEITSQLKRDIGASIDGLDDVTYSVDENNLKITVPKSTWNKSTEDSGNFKEIQIEGSDFIVKEIPLNDIKSIKSYLQNIHVKEGQSSKKPSVNVSSMSFEEQLKYYDELAK